MKAGSIVPMRIDRCRVLLFSVIDDRHQPTGACRDIVDGEEVTEVLGVAICQCPEDEGVFLYHYGDDSVPVTDTWHRSIEDARHQAELELKGIDNTWGTPPA